MFEKFRKVNTYLKCVLVFDDDALVLQNIRQHFLLERMKLFGGLGVLLQSQPTNSSGLTKSLGHFETFLTDLAMLGHKGEEPLVALARRWFGHGGRRWLEKELAIGFENSFRLKNFCGEHLRKLRVVVHALREERIRHQGCHPCWFEAWLGIEFDDDGCADAQHGVLLQSFLLTVNTWFIQTKLEKSRIQKRWK